MAEEDCFGCHCQKIVVLLFEHLQSTPGISDWITMFLDAQPKYIDPPSNLREQVTARKWANFDILPDLERMMGIFHSDSAALRNLIMHFGSLVLTATNYCLCTVNELTPDRINQDMVGVIREYRLSISYPLSRGPLEQRQQLAQINYRGTFELVVADFIELTTSTLEVPLSEIRWRMFQKFVNGILHTTMLHSLENVTCVRAALIYYDLQDFFDPDAFPVPGWECDSFHDLLEVVDDDFDEYDDLYDLPEAYLEPTGPEMRVENHATAVAMASGLSEDDCPICQDSMNVSETIRDEVPVKIKCGHCFHYGCLHTLINGISKFSNLCPNCRDVICGARERRLKDAYQSSFKNILSAGPSGTPEGMVADLQDTDGDVVMTDG